MSSTFAQLWAGTFRYVKEHSPYYRALLADHDTVPALAAVPLLDKATLSARPADFCCVPRERIVELVTTSGTTGEPLLWQLTAADVRRLAHNEQLSFGCAGLTAGDTVLIAVALDRCFMAGLAYWLGLREIGCGIVRTGAGSPRFVLEMLQRVQPTAIVGVPSFLRLVAETAQAQGMDLRAASVRKLICIGEPIRDTRWQLNRSGALLANAWNAGVFATYGVTELANSLCECEAGRGGHLHDEQLHLEILDDAGQPVADGEIGEVVATTWGVEGMPLLRYRTGDCAALFREPCACGRTTPRLGPIVGRRQHKLKVKGVSLYPATLTAILEQVPGVETFVVLAHPESELSDRIEVLVHGPVRLPELREAFQARAKITPQIRLAPRAEIEAWQQPPEARKRRMFVDRR
ncbi:MAG TPA: AMP-binding protein [Verrucomicrobiota bacterium]|nr:AMP-binding protein [Verrucomicrobiota bacterium]HNT15520.1 AMP-binding protein [Verrucomicrobiota bacterium]